MAARTAKSVPPRWRTEVVAFADAMERKLRENDHKGDWEECDIDYLLKRLRQETSELARIASDRDVRTLTNEEEASVVYEAADVANFAMFIADNCGGLAPEHLEGPPMPPDPNELARLQQRVTDLSRELQEANEENAQLRADLAIVNSGREDVWRWQGDGDAPESLSCPVVMSADTLRSLITPRTDGPLSFEVLRLANVARCEAVFHALDDWSPTDWACAFAGEAGEACNDVKKLRRLADRHHFDPKERERIVDRILHELADTVIYADLLAARLRRSLSKAVTEKFNIVSEELGSDILLATSP